MQRLFRALLNSLAEGESAALVTVVRATPSSRSRPGTKLLVRQDGSVLGDLGNGALQQLVLEQAQRALETGMSCRLSFALGDDSQLRPSSSPKSDVDVFVDVLQPRPKLLIIGAGHIGLELARLGQMLDMHVQVVDDRPEFADPDRITEADDVFLVSYDPQTEELAPLPVQITPSTYVVIATWGWDQPALLQIAGSDAAYIGLVASMRKARFIFDALMGEGVSREALASVRVPAGLDLGAETPAEIALSIMAEIVMSQRSASGRPMRETKGQRPA